LTLPLSFFFFTAPAPTEIYTLSLHDALPILVKSISAKYGPATIVPPEIGSGVDTAYDTQQKPVASWEDGQYALKLVRSFFSDVLDRKSTRLNSSHVAISYAVFCLKKKRNKH